jgi:NAD(P)-dependent dehydrogenase (short-subunit alcohol dehydrogenase family)
MDAELADRVALVTGAGSPTGIGFATAKILGREGAAVAICSTTERIHERAAELHDTGTRAAGFAADLTDREQVREMVDAVVEAFGRVDVLVNNAGVSPLYPTLSAVSEELFDKVVGVNLKGPFRLSALIGERMAAGDGGSIINISSTGAVRPTGDIVPYSAAKAGLNAMTVGFADALGPKVRVNAIMPGPFLTTISRNWDMEVLAERTRTFPLRRAGMAEEIVGAALYLASDASSYTTGCILTVDGGAQWSMPGGGAARSSST